MPEYTATTDYFKSKTYELYKQYCDKYSLFKCISATQQVILVCYCFLYEIEKIYEVNKNWFDMETREITFDTMTTHDQGDFLNITTKMNKKLLEFSRSIMMNESDV